MVPVLWADVLLPLFCVLVRGRAHSLTRGGTGEADNRTVLEPTGKFSLSCSPPIPSFRPIRDVLAHGEAAARERDDQRESLRLLRRRASALRDRGWGLRSRCYACPFEPKARNLVFPFPPVLRTSACALRGKGWGCQYRGARGSLYSKPALLTPYPFLSPY
jgi:hypothetical protein